MALAQSELQQASQRQPLWKYRPHTGRQRTAFLCHSHKDSVLAEGLQVLLAEQGVELYIDWKDATMPERPNRETAERIQLRIKTCDWVLFLATGNSMSSRWCPWELGYADGMKQLDRIAIVPTLDAVTTHGNEYLHLYRRVDLSAAGELLWVPPNSNQGQYVRSIPFL
ncbi:toll/interleukin-1 receptor domain-containing protein [Polaromonas hydrogenivorans]|uniref:Toll/interleukin-1 receptor domain-containing protein n=1 Tax=Polaromonas hydrogenivorans TaxID=335476 RepID=A0AAU7M2G4_9BURK